MSILNNPVSESAVAEGALIRLITDNVWNHRRPFMAFTENTNARGYAYSAKDWLFRADMFEVVEDLIIFKRKRSMVCGEIDWAKYGIITATSHDVLMFEEAHNSLPRNINARIVYFNDGFDRFENRKVRAADIVFSKYWWNADAGIYNTEVECYTMKFNDPPKVFENLTGRCEHIVFRCDEFADVPGLRAGLIKQTFFGKKIQQLKDVRAYFNNPKKYQYADPGILFDVPKFIEAAGLDKLRDLNSITIKDSGVQMEFAKHRNIWSVHISRL